MEEQMPENAWTEYEYWKDGTRDDPAKFTRDIPRFEEVYQRHLSKRHEF